MQNPTGGTEGNFRAPFFWQGSTMTQREFDPLVAPDHLGKALLASMDDPHEPIEPLHQPKPRKAKRVRRKPA